jgi:bifunctional non-homologous end joining protein LigD
MNKLPQITPLTLTLKREPFDHPEWLFELKHDGFRGVAYVIGKSCELVSRNGNAFKRFDPLRRSLGQLRVNNSIIDGEIVCLNDEGTSLFNELLFRLTARREKQPLLRRFLAGHGGGLGN